MPQSMKASLAQLVAHMPGARMTRNADVAGVSTDSRTLAPGELFVALRGETFDAHSFLPTLAGEAVPRAAAVVAEQLPAGWTLPALIVPNTLSGAGPSAHTGAPNSGFP